METPAEVISYGQWKIIPIAMYHDHPVLIATLDHMKEEVEKHITLTETPTAYVELCCTIVTQDGVMTVPKNLVPDQEPDSVFIRLDARGHSRE